MPRKSNLATMSIEALVDLRDEITGLLSLKADELRKQIARLNEGPIIVGTGKVAPRGRRGHALKGRKVAPKYRSKKDPKQTWSGRGAMPRWMVAETKASKLKKDNFLIK